MACGDNFCIAGDFQFLYSSGEAYCRRLEDESLQRSFMPVMMTVLNLQFWQDGRAQRL